MIPLLVAGVLQLGSPSRSSPIVDAPKPYVGQRVVQLGKQRYSVAIKESGEVVVKPKAMLSRRGAQMHDEMLRAIHQATGCQLDQELWEGVSLHGKLKCGVAPR